MGAIWSSDKKVRKYKTYFKNSFAWLMGMTELIFGYQKIFGSGHFLIFFQISWIEKKPRAKKVVNIKNQFLHARQPREGIFDICSHQCCIFTISCQSFQWLPLFQFQELVSQTWYRDIWGHDLDKFGWQSWFRSKWVCTTIYHLKKCTNQGEISNLEQFISP